jgi:hypothetical protein
MKYLPSYEPGLRPFLEIISSKDPLKIQRMALCHTIHSNAHAQMSVPTVVGQKMIRPRVSRSSIPELAISQSVTWKETFTIKHHASFRPSSGASIGVPANSLQRTRSRHYINVFTYINWSLRRVWNCGLPRQIDRKRGGSRLIKFHHAFYTRAHYSRTAQKD